uniref:Capsid protein n=1 Tax=Cressdnaviricota sp. TaxID=2748378 RepID=A0A6M3YS28_9VIRU|nr:MAG: capsid protein [Cressdnaviricota sp.]
MPYARKPRIARKRRAPLIRKRTYRKRAAPTARYTKTSRMVSKRLNDGVQYKSTLYGNDIALVAGTTSSYFYNENFVRDIPKYRNDPTASSKQANFAQCRTSDKILLRGFKVSIGINNNSSYPTAIRIIMIRSKSFEEVPATNAVNWCKGTDGGSTSPSGEMQTHLTERFNFDLCTSRRDFIFDRRVILGQSASLDTAAFKRISFFVPLNHVCIFESKGDTSSADDLKTGRYGLMIWSANTDEANGGNTAIHYDINAVWAQA